MNKSPFFTSLANNELNRLGTFLHQFPDAMNLEVMDGFFAALICMPQAVTVKSVFSRVWGGTARFNTVEEAYEISNLIMRHWHTILQTLDKGDLYYPLLLEDRNGKVHANDWAHGFNTGMQFSPRHWAGLLTDESHNGWIIPIFMLADEYASDPERHLGVIDEEQRQKLISRLVIGLKKIHDYFLPQVRAAEYKTITPQWTRDTMIRRNELCLCGSGRKYKQCCGNTAEQPPLIRSLH